MLGVGVAGADEKIAKLSVAVPEDCGAPCPLPKSCAMYQMRKFWRDGRQVLDLTQCSV